MLFGISLFVAALLLGIGIYNIFKLAHKPNCSDLGIIQVALVFIIIQYYFKVI